MVEKAMSWLNYLSSYPLWVLIAEAMLIGSAIVLLLATSPSRVKVSEVPETIEVEAGVRYVVWKPFLNGRCTIVVGTYYHEDINWWEPTGLIGTSSALAIGTILGALTSLRGDECDILPSSGLAGDRLQDNLILIGGPDANEVTRKVIEKISPRLRFGDPDQHVVSITDASDGKMYSPRRSSTGDITDDYGIAVKTKNPFDENENSYVIIVAGSFGHGTHAAARMLESNALLSKVPAVEKDGFELLLHTEVINRWPQAPTVLKAYPL